MLDFDDGEQVFHFRWQFAETVDDLGGEAVDAGAAVDLVEAAVERHAHVQVGHIMIRDQDRHFGGDLRAEGFGGWLHAGGFGAGFQDRLFQHRLVEFEADLLDVTGLFVAEQIAGAALIEIMAGQLEAGAQRIEL